MQIAPHCKYVHCLIFVHHPSIGKYYPQCINDSEILEHWVYRPIFYLYDVFMYDLQTWNLHVHRFISTWCKTEVLTELKMYGSCNINRLPILPSTDKNFTYFFHFVGWFCQWFRRTISSCVIVIQLLKWHLRPGDVRFVILKKIYQN